MKSIWKLNTCGLGLLILLSFALIGVTNHYILTISLYDNGGEMLSGIPAREGEVMADLHKWVYLSAALYLILKIGLIALILYTALYLTDNTTSYSRVFNAALLSEFIFLIPAGLKIYWFHHQYADVSLNDWRKFYPLSVMYLIENVPPDWYYPLQTLNLFELGYWFLLAYWLSKRAGINFDKALRLVALSYVPALVIWMITVAFCMLMLVPSGG